MSTSDNTPASLRFIEYNGYTATYVQQSDGSFAGSLVYVPHVVCYQASTFGGLRKAIKQAVARYEAFLNPPQPQPQPQAEQSVSFNPNIFAELGLPQLADNVRPYNSVD